MSLPYEALPHTRVEARQAAAPEPFGADVPHQRHRLPGDRLLPQPVSAAPTGVSLHIECDRWWDIDSDGAPVEAGPAQTVRLTGRCWKEVRSVWVSHRKAR